MTQADRAFDLALQARIDLKTKPQGALGRLEDLAAQIARLQGVLTPRMQTCRLMIFAADHGIADEGVSAYPQSVTRQMVLNFLAGGAAATVFARSLGVAVDVVDCGVVGGPIGHPALLQKRLGDGCANSLHSPALSSTQMSSALGNGSALVDASASDAVCFGEMGIANSSAAALVCAKILDIDVAALAGRGTGLDEKGLHHKRTVLTQAAARTQPRLSAESALSEYGGFEIATMTGAMIAAARNKRLVLVDGFIATAAALAALSIDPTARAAMVFCHRSAELGHGIVLDRLAAPALLDLGLRLGEGTGALLAWPLVRSAAVMLNEMASFEEAGVSGPQ